MENSENKNDRITQSEQSLKTIQSGLKTVSNLKECEIFVPHNAQEKLEKEREFYDSKDNPARKFNINDQAYSQSSAKDFITTISSFHHADQANDKGQYSADE